MANPKENIRILLTEQCNANCTGCFNKNIRTGQHMDMNDYNQLIDYLSGHGISFLKVMGGEPTIHPHFEEAIRLAGGKFGKLCIFTNALNERIKNITLREADVVVYNYSFINQSFDLAKMLPDEPGSRLLEVQISSGTNADSLISSLAYFFRHISDDKIKISLTLDCMEDIFVNRDVIIENWNRVVVFILTELKKRYVFDHSIPWCFFEHTDMLIRHEIRLCNIQCAGLITTDLRLQHCNQCQEKGVYLKTENGFIPFDRLLQSLCNMNQAKIQANKDKICSECGIFSTKCNGGCFIHKSFTNPAGVPLNHPKS
ncbi:MAG: radical SAM protein [Thermincola sp.]|jgi:sulfatase maturation enzyme AslB (radical SAM superfamily)|nr:radical SAM protein [Thermincola sp.]MDT3702984.1 radical SAM protein [Thermincola sp.]